MSNKTAAVEKVVREALHAVKPGIELIDGDVDLAREFGLDSLQVMDMIMEIEDHLDISVPVEILADARSFNQLCAGITRLVERRT